jgi:ZipA-like protein with FtsZ-binding domain
MSDLVLGLLVLGALLFGGVLVYNRLQVRSAERAAERAFGSGHADTLLEEPPARREPTLKGQSFPDARVDYVIELRFTRAVAPGAIHGQWTPVQQRFGRRALLGQSDDSSWHAALQLVSRAGVVSDAELVEFRSAVETLGAKLGASVVAPEMRAALEAARELDRACADSDIQVALHVVGQSIESPAGEQPFQVVRREDGVTLVMDVALTPDLGRSYEAMARAGRDLAAAHGARLVDDRGNPLDERALAAIGAQLEAVRQVLAHRGIETGSPLAARLFS